MNALDELVGYKQRWVLVPLGYVRVIADAIIYLLSDNVQYKDATYGISPLSARFELLKYCRSDR
ncbi:hypothetical protein FD723_23525 [Nostoc sp. C052]|uniref:hypothetical protein n=1 Tax=Nostoc sp. C052 TaxID=2576902 RepID=UPI0015C3313F|nr:hypothetical protein [Nostoc sp. C052]QLE43123.1 hypothetical protein FD723_23525 [Nostoc sp. C052]